MLIYRTIACIFQLADDYVKGIMLFCNEGEKKCEKQRINSEIIIYTNINCYKRIHKRT